MAVMAAAAAAVTFFYSLYGWLEWQRADGSSGSDSGSAVRCARMRARGGGTCDAELENTTALPLAYFVADVLRASKEMAQLASQLTRLTN